MCVFKCMNKMGELRLMVEDVEPDIIGITETWTRPDMGNAEFSLFKTNNASSINILCFIITNVR